MDERMPWPTRTAAAALGVVFVLWVLGLGLLVTGSNLGWLWVGLATWLTFGLLSTVLHESGNPS